jgi:2-amino-4-hydroxy-6-hydroxymethyldihydropteridine diphosphokinase
MSNKHTKNSKTMIFLSLGTNLGDKSDNIDNACIQIQNRIGQIIQQSPVYETEPWGFDTENVFFNLVLQIQSHFSAFEILHKAKTIESEMGRAERKSTGYASRIIDIDILFYGYQVVHAPELVIPHPRIHERKFVLVPLNDIAPDFLHPEYNKTISQLLANCPDVSVIKGL